MPRCLIAALLLLLRTAFAVDPSPFSPRQPLPTPATLNAITWFQSQFVAVGENDGSGNVFRTTDGTSWRISACDTADVLRGVATDSTKLVCVGDAGRIFLSSDSLAWAPQNSGITNNLYAVAFGAGQFVAVGGDYPQGVILTSSNGATWELQSFTNLFLRGVAYGNGVWVVVANSYSDHTTILVSSNAFDWSVRGFTVALYQEFSGVTYGSSGFVAVGGADYAVEPVALSYDGTTWDKQSVSNSWFLNLSSVCWDGTKYVAVGETYDSDSDDYVGCTTAALDGVHWSQPLKVARAKSLNGIAASSSNLVAVGANGSIVSSAHGSSWLSQGPASTAPLSSVIFADGKFVAVGDSATPASRGPGVVRQSGNGTIWGVTELTNGFDPSLYDVTFANGLHVGVGGRDGGDIQTSTDGTNWTLQSNICCGFSGVTFGPQGFVAVGAFYLGGIASIATSPDGLVWTSRNSGLTNDSSHYRYLSAVTYGNGLYVAVGYSGSIVTSPNATNWTRRGSSTAPYWLNDVIYTNGAFLAVGTSGTILKSSSGTSWAPIAAGIAESLNAITYANGTYVAVGYKGAIIISTNANTWTKVQSSTTLSLFDICYGNGTFVAVGDRGVILQSRDFLHPRLQLIPAPLGFDIAVTPPEFGRQYRVEASESPDFATAGTVSVFSNTHANFVLHDNGTNASRFYRTASP